MIKEEQTKNLQDLKKIGIKAIDKLKGIKCCKEKN